MAESLTIDQQKAVAMMSMRKRQAESTSPNPNAPRTFMESMSARAGEAMDAKPSGMASFIREAAFGFDPMTPLDKAAGVVASPIGAAGETLERKAGQAMGAPAVPLEKAARDTGDVSEALLSIMPGGRVAKGAEAVGEGIAGAGEGIAKGAKITKEGYHARTPEVLDNVGLKYEAMAGKHFADMRKSGVTMKPAITMKAAENVEKDLTAPGKGKLNPHLHGETMKVLADMKAHAKKGFDVEDLDQYRRRLSEVAGKSRMAGNKEDAKKAADAIEAIDEQFETMKKEPGMPPDVAKSIDSLQSGQKIWAARRKFETLATAIKKGEGDPNKIASEFDKILQNPRLHRGFTEEQMKAVEAVAKNTTTEGLLKMAGKFGITIGTGRAAATGNALPAIEGIWGALAPGGGVPAAAAITAGTGAKMLYKYGKAGKAERALKAIESEVGTDETLGAATDPLAVRK